MTHGSLDVGRPMALPRAPGVRAGSAKLLVLTCLLVAAAGVRSLRLELGGLFVPMHVLPILAAVPVVVVPNFGRFPRAVRVPLLVFLLLFGISVVRYGESFGDLVKMATSVLTIFAVALMVRQNRHFVTGSVSLAIALIAMNLNGIRGGYVDYVGYMPLGDLANKNAYSLYALPIVLLTTYTLVQFRTGWFARAVIVGAIVSTAFVLFTGANRSGWGGMVLIGALVAIQGRRWRELFAVAVLGLLSYGVFSWLGTRQTLEHRIQQTRDGYSSDEYRVMLFTTALEIASENPVFGLTPQELHVEMARRLGAESRQVDTHNIVGYIAGGSGFPALLALLAVAIALCRRPVGATPQMLAASDLLRMLCVLFVVRGLFSREVFFVGPVPIALGLALGLAIISQDEARRASPAQRPA